MRITDIKAQVKRAGRYSVFVDGIYTFSLSDTALLEAAIKPGQEIDEARLAQLKHLAVDDTLYAAVLNYVSLRPRSAWELETYLRRKEASAAQAQAIMTKLEHLGLINDFEFASSWIRSRRLLKPTSHKKLTLELRAKHVQSAVIAQALTADPETNDPDALKRLVVTKRRIGKYADNVKLMQYLARQGFSYDDIKAAMHETAGDDY